MRAMNKQGNEQPDLDLHANAGDEGDAFLIDDEDDCDPEGGLIIDDTPAVVFTDDELNELLGVTDA